MTLRASHPQDGPYTIANRCMEGPRSRAPWEASLDGQTHSSVARTTSPSPAPHPEHQGLPTCAGLHPRRRLRATSRRWATPRGFARADPVLRHGNGCLGRGRRVPRGRVVLAGAQEDPHGRGVALGITQLVVDDREKSRSTASAAGPAGLSSGDDALGQGPTVTWSRAPDWTSWRMPSPSWASRNRREPPGCPNHGGTISASTVSGRVVSS